jgi:hypothetical protein
MGRGLPGSDLNMSIGSEDHRLGSLHAHEETVWAGPVSGPEAIEAGEAVLAEAVEAYAGALGERLAAAYALGSLSHGGFSPLVSDVDLGLILAEPLHPSDPDTLLSVAERLRTRGSALHQRLSVFWGTRASLRGEGGVGRFPPLDRLCLLEHGRLLWGQEARMGLPRPDPDELLVSGAEFALELLARDTAAELHDPERLLSRGVRWVTKVVLFPVRFLFTAQTGQEGTNDDAAARYLAGDAPGSTLVAAALAWRTAPPEAGRAAVLLRELVPLYLHYIDDHSARLAAAGRADLAGSFRRWRSRLTARAASGRGDHPVSS